MNDQIWGEIVTVFMGFFAIMNPATTVPIFLSMTAGEEPEIRKAIAFRSVGIAFGLVTVFALAGNLIFQVFGITLSAFQIAGGLLILLIGFQMVQGTPSSVHQPRPSVAEGSKAAALDIAISPLATPLMAGPGTLTTAMIFSGQSTGHVVISIICFGLLCGITLVFFLFGARFVRFIGPGALGAMLRMMGLILAVIGVQMLVTGIKATFHLGDA